MTVSILEVVPKLSLKLICPGIVIDVSPLQKEKAPCPILVTLFGIVIEVSPIQPEKAPAPILVTLLGILIEVSPLQPAKAPSPILVTLYVLLPFTTVAGIAIAPAGSL